MFQKIKIVTTFCALLVFFTNKINAQAPGEVEVNRIANYMFSADSLNGFDEQAASAGALSTGCYGREYKVFMSTQKRIFIKQKYNLKTAAPAPLTLFQNPMVQRTTAIGGACNNEDFELATGTINPPTAIPGWTATSGVNSGLGCTNPNLPGVGVYTVFTSPIIDDVTNIQVSSYFDASTNVTPAGSAFIRLSDRPANSTVSRLSKSFIVGPGNALFQYAYLPVIEDGPGHTCCQQAGFNIKITVTNTATSASTVLACPQISVAVPGTGCPFVPPAGSPVFIAAATPNWSYHNWAASAIDLTPYINNQITLDITVRDCDQGGHTGYAYFDAKCSPMTVLGNNNPFPAGSQSFTLPTCGANTATICAPDGLGPYSWAGPGVVAPYNTPSNANQCFVAGLSADFTLTMNPPGSCSPINRVMTVTITPAPLILANVTQAICGGSTAVVSFTAAGSASVNPVIVWTPVPTSTTSSAVNLGTATFPAGIGAVTVTAYDPLGCKVAAIVTVNPVPPQPTVTIQNVTGSSSITCITPTIDLFASTTYTYGTLNYSWISNNFTSNQPSVNVVSGATLITLTSNDPVTGCVTTATTAITVNTVAPVSSVNPANQSINCGPGAIATVTGTAISPTINVSHVWYGPGGVPPTLPVGGVTSIYNPAIVGANGTSTFVLTNLVNGCSTTKTVQVVSNAGAYPSFAVTSSSTQSTFTLGCTTRSVTDVNIVNGNTTPPGGAISYTILPPGFTGTNYTTSIVNTYTINAPGTYILIVKDNNNACETRIPLSVVQNTFSPNIFTSAITQTLTCDVPSVVLQGTTTTQNVTYVWKSNSVPPSVPNSSITVNTTTAGASVASATVIDVYTLTVVDASLLGNNCPSSTVVTMYQNTRPPKPNIVGAVPLTCLTFSVNLTNNSVKGILPNTFFGNQPIVATLWEGPTPQLPLANSSTYLGYTAGIYTMTVKDLNNGCTSQTTTTIADNRVYPTLVTNTLIPLDCGAAATGGVKLAVTALNLTPSGVTVEWTTPLPPPNISGANSLTLTTNGVGEYKATVTTNTNGCKRSIDITVVNGVLNANFTADQTTGYAPLTVNFTNNSASSSTATGSSSITSVWSFGNGTTRTTTTNVGTSAVYAQPGTYTVTMFSGKGTCLDTFVQVIRVDIPSKLEVPNVFTPNGDGTNDLFFVKTANLSEITALIYDRWGNKIYELTTEKGNIAWDGKSNNGKEAPDGTYFYIITAKGKDGQTYDTKGTVSLYR